MNASEPIDVAVSERLGEVAARFQQTWQAHRDDPQAVDLASFLPALGDSLRMDALLRLIPLDLAGRWQNGVPISLEDYIQRFPELGPLDRVPPQLIADEYRIRAQYGVISPHSVLRQRFPKQYGVVEKLIQSDPGQLFAATVVPKESFPPPLAHGGLLMPNIVVGDHYRLNKLLGRGGFGEVWHATDLRGDIDKAIKILSRSADSDDAQKEFESLNIVKRINHPCLLRTESYFVERDRLFIVLELADATLRDVLKKSQTDARTGIPVDALLVNMKHAAEGLDFLHKQGILHRDVKPENILLVGDYAKVADFGLAKEAHNKQSTKADFAGTVVYSAPETWDGRVTTRSDQYSLAATYFELRTGCVLFGGKTFQEIFRKHIEAKYDFGPLPDLEQDVLRRALSKTPEDRFPTCAAFVHALDQAVLASGSKVVASQPPVPAAATHQNNIESTHDGDSAVSRVNAGLRAAAVLRSNPDQAPPRKWNEAAPGRSRRAKKRSRALPVVALVGFLLVAGLGAFAMREHFMDGEPVLPVNAQIDKPAERPPPALPPIPSPIQPKANEPKELPPPSNPAYAKLNEAGKLLDAKDFAKSKMLVDGLNVLNDADERLKSDALSFYARYLQEADLTREELRAFDGAIVDDPSVKPVFVEAMTKKLIESCTEWTDNEVDWKILIGDCERAEPTNPVIQAIKAEANLQAGARIMAPLPAPADGERPYVTYVRARVAASQGKKVSAAKGIALLPKDAEWLKDKRATFAALILQDGANELTPQNGERLRFFASPDDADRAFAWQMQALVLLNNPSAEEQRTLAWQCQLNTALAAACKSEPDFAQCKTIGDSLLKNPQFNAKVSVIELALAHPAGFPQEFVAFRGKLAAEDLEPIIRLGAAQRQKLPTNSTLRSRQALLWYTKGRILDRAADIDADLLLATDKEALALDEENTSYQVAVGRAEALVALARSYQAAGSAAKIQECERGLAASEKASLKSDVELWPDLRRVRGLLYLEIGREAGRPDNWTKPAAKMAFQNAIAAAGPALTSSYPKLEEIAAVVAQAHEALAHLGRDDIKKNYGEAVRLYGQAVAGQPRYVFERGRCRYRWATDEMLKLPKKDRDVHLSEAIKDFEAVAKVPDFAAAAEAHYWEALAHWDRIERISSTLKAKAAFERSLAAAAKDPPAGGAWAKFALHDLVAMTRKQAKNAPELSAKWLLDVLPVWETLSKDAVVGADKGFAEVDREYRDLLAETSADAAERDLKFKNLDKYRAHIDRAVAMKHSTKHAVFAVSRAVSFKQYAADLKITPEETAAARREATVAIEAADPAIRETLRQRLNAGSP